MRAALLLCALAACVDAPPDTSAAESDICQDGHDCTHLLPTCADLGCPYKPSAVSFQFIPCPIAQSVCWCWSPITNDEAWQCQQL